ncbi:MAG TPA: wax ester/triacylglycerol synthase family O-acyltransferase [Longimicrobiales bacterium]|nr:wax ester/triacylglycerol synthase family O-acyltransferase [Longimicrobiales bacterium]
MANVHPVEPGARAGRPNGGSLSAADAAWWFMEEPTNQMTITAVLTFAGRIPYEGLRELLATRLLRHERFRQRVAMPAHPGPPRWVAAEDFSLDEHVLRDRLPPPADRQALQEHVSEVMSRRLDYARPLWEFRLVENYAEGAAVIARFHHCIADGVALIRVLLTLGDPEGDAGMPREPGTPQATSAPSAGPAEPAPAAGPGAATRRPGPPSGARGGVAAAASLAHLLGMRRDPRTLLSGRLCPRKRAAWSEPFPLQSIKDAAHRIGGTINDVLVSAVAGALGAYLERHGAPAAGLTLHAVVPVNLRRDDDTETLGNRFGMVFLPLPVGTRDAIERLRAVKAAMDRIKRSPEAMVVYGLLAVFGRTAKRMLEWAVGFFGRSASLVLTNVPGPRGPIRFCGVRMTGLIAWVPQSARLALGISVLSYDGQVQLGVASDAGIVPDPDIIVEAFGRALRDLLERVGVPVAPRVEGAPAPDLAGAAGQREGAPAPDLAGAAGQREGAPALDLAAATGPAVAPLSVTAPARLPASAAP